LITKEVYRLSQEEVTLASRSGETTLPEKNKTPKKPNSRDSMMNKNYPSS
jgi:hypothetical protein